MCQTFATLNSNVAILPRYGRIWYLRLFFIYSTFLSPLTSLIDFFSLLTIYLSPNQCSFLFRSDSQLLPQSQTSFSLFAPQIKPKYLLSSLFAPQIKLQFPVQNKTQKWNHYKPNRSPSYQRKNKGIGDGGEVELGARDGEAMKIDVWAVSEVHEGEVRCQSVRHDHACRQWWNLVFI